MDVLLWSIAGYILGSFPFSYWIARVFINEDIREYGDSNPGAVNAFKAGGWKIGLLAIILDSLKGAIPVGLANYIFDINNWELLPIALAPIIGHAFSPFLGFHGGKAVAVSFGVWTGLLLWEGPTVLGISLGLIVLIQLIDAWSVIMAMGVLIVYLALRQFDSVLLVIGLCNLGILIWKHRFDLMQVPGYRPWIAEYLRSHF